MGILWPHSNTAPRTNADRRAPGALAYFYEAGTTTPRPTFQDAGLNTPHPHPIVADAYGRFPAVFIDFGSYRERVKTAGNTQLWDTDNIPNPAPTDPGEGVPAVSLLSTGMFVFELTDDTRTGFVRANGRTIGSSNSGASERANDDTEPLYTRLYQKLDNTACPVEGGRGANAAADFAANKKMTLPDLRGRGPIGLDTMGASSASARLATPVAGFVDKDKPGYVVGANTHQLLIAELPTITPSGGITPSSYTPAGIITPSSYTPQGGLSGIVSLGLSDTRTWSLASLYYGQHNGVNNDLALSTGTAGSLRAGTVSSTGGSLSGNVNLSTGTFSGTPQNFSFSGTPQSFSFNGTPFGSNTAHNNVASAVLGTWYIKL